MAHMKKLSTNCICICICNSYMDISHLLNVHVSIKLFHLEEGIEVI